MLNGKFDFGEGLSASCRATVVQSERPPGERQLAKLSAAMLFAVLLISPVDRAFADTPVTSAQSGTVSAEASESWIQDMLGRLGNSGGISAITLFAPGEQIILAQTDVNAVCTSFRSGDAWKVLPPGGEARSTCGPAFMTYRGGGYGSICKPARKGVTDVQKDNAQDALEAFQFHCKCSTQCKP